jgi:hypothetical protein
MRVSIHFRGFEIQERSLPAIPTKGQYIAEDDRLWKVGDTFFEDGEVHTFAIPVSARLAEELLTEWTAWGIPPATTDRTAGPGASDQKATRPVCRQPAKSQQTRC